MAADKRITVYLTAEDKAEFETMAYERGKDASEWLRDMVKREISKAKPR